ncbi:MAG: WD40 repeat domain-containing protein [Phycisphaerae bacterium]|nr:WD40 repeat domain-containing protein [Phycisphaerae bacterium]
MRRLATLILILAGAHGGCVSGDYYRGRVLLAPNGGGGVFDAFGDRLPGGAVRRLGTGRLGHGNFVRRIVYSPDGKMIASWGGDMRCRFWAAGSGRLIWAAPTWYRMPLFSPDRRHVAMLYSGDIHLVSLDSGKVVRTFGNRRGQIVWAGFAHGAHGGRRLVTIATDRTVRVWSVGLGLEMRKIELGADAMRVMNVAAISPDGKLLAVSTGYSSVSVLDLDRGECVRTLKTPKPAWVTKLAFAGDGGGTLCGRLHDSKTLFWDVGSGRLCDGVAPPGRPGVFAVSPDGRTVAYASGGRIRLEDARTGAELPASARIPRCDSVLEMMAFRGDGAKTLVTAAAEGLWRWDVGTGRDREMLAAATAGGGKWAAVSGDGRLAALVDGRGLASVYDIATGKRIALIEGGGGKITTAAFSGDGKMLVTASRDSVALWNLPGGTRAGAIALDKKKYLGVRSLELAGDGKTVVAVVTRPNPRVRDDRRVKGPREASHMQPATVQGIEIFDLVAGKCRGRIGGLLFALSPDSRTLAKPGYKCIELWDLASLKQTGTLKCGEAVGSGMMGAAMRLRFSPDGRKLARALIAQRKFGERIDGGNGCVELLDLGGGASRIFKVDGISTAPVMAFSADSRTLATAGAGGAILLWDISRRSEDRGAR